MKSKEYWYCLTSFKCFSIIIYNVWFNYLTYQTIEFGACARRQHLFSNCTYFRMTVSRVLTRILKEGVRDFPCIKREGPSQKIAPTPKYRSPFFFFLSYDSPLRIIFFYTCPKYADVRNRYLSDLLPTHNVHDLLFGKENAPDNDNELLFLKVQDYYQIQTVRAIAHNITCYNYKSQLLVKLSIIITPVE